MADHLRVTVAACRGGSISKSTSLELYVKTKTCIKSGIDNKGGGVHKSIGLVAGDEFCYETFRDLFDPVVNQNPPVVRSTPLF